MLRLVNTTGLTGYVSNPDAGDDIAFVVKGTASSLR